MDARKTDVAVIGLGAMGAAALYQLARRGVTATGIDRFDPPHDRGSTHGETRVTRLAVGEGAAFVPVVQRSHEIWRELERTTGTTLMVPCGELLVGPEDSRTGLHQQPGFFRQTRAVVERFGLPYELLDRTALASRFPQFTSLAADDAGFLDLGGGYLHVERCVTTQLAEARRLGAEVLVNTLVQSIASAGVGVAILTTAGIIMADHAIVAAGAWTANLLGLPFDTLLRVTRQVLYWFEPDEASLYDPQVFPAFIRITGPGDDEMFYGIPTPEGGAGVKLGTEQSADTTSPDAVGAVEATEGAAFHARHIAPFLRGVSARLLRAKSCFYTEAPGGISLSIDCRGRSGFMSSRHALDTASSIRPRSVRRWPRVSLASGEGSKSCWGRSHWRECRTARAAGHSADYACTDDSGGATSSSARRSAFTPSHAAIRPAATIRPPPSR